ncbi:uncharacterized protein LOC110826222 isoform X2 [Carica papaya]|uniref:uncharacterized protein LOC110826222 isoform X2 n=1 Tax=Carica papaya TaxID=3649 RepID=UPI000B8CC280|nr:uncharacterized protein LOC110826222 isoform X2 [Carica papaya]
MASVLDIAPLLPLRASTKSWKCIRNCRKQKVLWNQDVFQGSSIAKLHYVEAKAAAGSSNQNTKPNSVICADCDGNGAVLCSQCKGSGVNAADVFNGQFKAGDSCWLCGGKKEMLCGNCNGAGFIGGFMSTFDE